LLPDRPEDRRLLAEGHVQKFENSRPAVCCGRSRGFRVPADTWMDCMVENEEDENKSLFTGSNRNPK
jgi:hypothetical protein